MRSVDLFSVYLILPALLWPMELTRTANKNEHQDSCWGVKARLAREDDNFTAICELSRECGIAIVSQIYRSELSVNEIALLSLLQPTTVSVLRWRHSALVGWSSDFARGLLCCDDVTVLTGPWHHFSPSHLFKRQHGSSPKNQSCITTHR
jgi:hypothetical protein